MTLRSLTLLAATSFAFIAGCFTTVTPLVTSDSGGTDSTITDGSIRCGSNVCTSGQACCSATGTCYDPRCLACCMPTIDSGSDVTVDSVVIEAGDAPAIVCHSGADCGAGRDCIFATAGCGITGTCMDHNSLCTRPFQLFCGCDGVTFSETCEGPPAPWVSTGACADAGADAGLDGGTSCNSAADCATGLSCIWSTAGCGFSGVCRRDFACGRPSVEYCGCDGSTFFDLCVGPPRPWVHAGACTVDGGTVEAGGTDASACVGCTSSQSCCMIPGPRYGTCYASGCLACCM